MLSKGIGVSSGVSDARGGFPAVRLHAFYGTGAYAESRAVFLGAMGGAIFLLIVRAGRYRVSGGACPTAVALMWHP